MAAAMAWAGSQLTMPGAGNIPAAGTVIPGSGWISMVGKPVTLVNNHGFKAQINRVEFLQKC